MEYFKQLQDLLRIERDEDLAQYRRLVESATVAERRANGLLWYPIAIRGTEPAPGDYLIVEVERTTHHELSHQLRFGASAALFSNHDAANNLVEGVVTFQGGNKLKIHLRTDELPEWTRDGKLGIDLLFDNNSYDEMQKALKAADALGEKKSDGHLVQVLTGAQPATFRDDLAPVNISSLNEAQNRAVNKILAANELAIVHGPPGTGKTTTVVQAIKALKKQDQQRILVVAPSNTAVDLLSERLAAEGLNVLRVGNPARVSEHLMALTLDSKMQAHAGMKDIKRLKKQANEFRDMAHKYKRNFGKAEREQRKALFDEAHKILKEVGRTEQYITDDLINKADVITATLVGANHYTVQQLKYHTVVIDEAGQSIEPACWIPLLKAQKVVLAGDHLQLSPTIKSPEAARKGLTTTLLEKCVAIHPDSVVLLDQQYRMNEEIMGYSSKVFYEGRLRADASVAHHLLFADDRPLLFIDTAGCGFDEKQEGTSVSNPEEASFMLRHLAGFTSHLGTIYNKENFPTIAVISPYKEQIYTLKDQLDHVPETQEFRSKIAVNTIDSFQGQERDIVYISMVRSNTDGVVGFLADIRRMNVAMTRARKKLVIVGDSSTLSQNSFYEGFVNYAQEHDAYMSAWELMDS